MPRLYRWVSNAEYDDLVVCRRFRAIGPSVEGKYFTDSQGRALAWGKLLDGSPATGHVVAVDLSEDVVAMLDHFIRLDDIGPAWFAHISRLEGMTPILNLEAMS